MAPMNGKANLFFSYDAGNGRGVLRNSVLGSDE